MVIWLGKTIIENDLIAPFAVKRDRTYYHWKFSRFKIICLHCWFSSFFLLTFSYLPLFFPSPPLPLLNPHNTLFSFTFNFSTLNIISLPSLMVSIRGYSSSFLALNLWLFCWRCVVFSHVLPGEGDKLYGNDIWYFRIIRICCLG